MYFSGVFALAICLMVFQVPETEGHGHGYEIISTRYKPKEYKFYTPVGTTIEVCRFNTFKLDFIFCD